MPSSLAGQARMQITLGRGLYQLRYTTVSEYLIIIFAEGLTYLSVMVQLGGVISNNIYREDDKPLYHRGNNWLIVANGLSIAVFLMTKLYYVTINKRRERVWQRLTVEVSYNRMWQELSLKLC
jgi:predicted RNA-binding protein associated with RNAse of E/G family